MSTGLIVLLVIVGVMVVFVFWGIAVYNQLITLKNRFSNAFAQIDVQLQRRYDLIPNLVETAKNYMSYEKETLTKVIEARNIAQAAAKATSQAPGDISAMKELNAAESSLGGFLGRFFALSENYPDLKANATMQQLMEELTSTENKVGFARQSFNDAVMIYNTYRMQFPNVIIANLFGYQDAAYFEISKPEAKEAVKVNFG